MRSCGVAKKKSAEVDKMCYALHNAIYRNFVVEYIGQTEAELKWADSECADYYIIKYSHLPESTVDTPYLQSDKVEDKVEVNYTTLQRLESCSKYHCSIAANYEDMDSPALTGTFILFSAWNSDSVRSLLALFISDICTLYLNAILAMVSSGNISASTH